MREADSSRLDVFEIRCLRTMVRVMRMDRVRNEDVRWRMGVERKLSDSGSEGAELVWASGENG